MFNKKFTLIITLTAAAMLSACHAADCAEYGGEPRNAAADGGSSAGNITVFSNGGVQIDHPDEGYVEYIPPQNTSSDDSESEDLLSYDTVRVTKEQLSDIAADTSYADILDKLGKTQAFGQPYYRQYVTDDDRIIQLYFGDKDDLCPYSGAELYERALSLEYDGETPEGMMYGILGRDGFFIHYMWFYYTENDLCGCGRRITGDYLMTSDTEIVFEDGSPASADDLKPETAVFIKSDYTLESYPGQMHCTKIIILK